MAGQRAPQRRSVRSKRAWFGAVTAVVAETLGNAGGIAITVLTKDKLDPLPLVLAVTGVSTVVGLLVAVLPKDAQPPVEQPSPVVYPGRPAPAVRRPRYVSVASLGVVMLLLCGGGGVAAAYGIQKGFRAFCNAAALSACATDNVEISASATGPAPWTVEGHGIRFEVASTKRTSSSWMGQTKPSITITAYVTRTAKADFKAMNYRISDQASGAVLESVPFGGGTGDGDPPLNQRSKLVFVVWDASPKATRLTFTLHDFYWADGRDLILRNVPVPSPAA